MGQGPKALSKQRQQQWRLSAPVCLSAFLSVCLSVSAAAAFYVCLSVSAAATAAALYVCLSLSDLSVCLPVCIRQQQQLQ